MQGFCGKIPQRSEDDFSAKHASAPTLQTDQDTELSLPPNRNNKVLSSSLSGIKKSVVAYALSPDAIIRILCYRFDADNLQQR